MDLLSMILNSFLLFIIILSYAPQSLRIKRRQSTYGLSPLFILLSSISSASNLANLLVLPVTFYHVHERCRAKYSGGRCVMELMAHWQVAAHWVCSQVIFLQYLWHHVRDRSSPAYLSHHIRTLSAAIPVGHERDGFLPPQYSRTALAIATTSAVFHILFLGPSLFLATSVPQYGPGYFIIMQIWSWINICISALLAFIHFLPQIYYTWSLGRVGSLSISTMVMQVPAYFLLAASLALRFQIDSSETVFANYTDRAIAWVNYLCSGCEQSILLGLSIMYVMPGKGRLLAEESEQGEEDGREDNPPAEENGHEDAGERPSCPPDEQTPLLSNDPGRASS